MFSVAIGDVNVRWLLIEGFDQVDPLLLISRVHEPRPTIGDVAPRSAPYHLLDFVIKTMCVRGITNLVLSQEPYGLVLATSHLVTGMKVAGPD